MLREEVFKDWKSLVEKIRDDRRWTRNQLIDRQEDINGLKKSVNMPLLWGSDSEFKERFNFLKREINSLIFIEEID